MWRGFWGTMAKVNVAKCDGNGLAESLLPRSSASTPAASSVPARRYNRAFVERPGGHVAGIDGGVAGTDPGALRARRIRLLRGGGDGPLPLGDARAPAAPRGPAGRRKDGDRKAVGAVPRRAAGPPPVLRRARRDAGSLRVVVRQADALYAARP